MASLKVAEPPKLTCILLRDGKHAMRHAVHEGSRDVVSYHQPVLRIGSQFSGIAAVRVVGVFQVDPPLAEEMYPTKSWHVAAEQLLCG